MREDCRTTLEAYDEEGRRHKCAGSLTLCHRCHRRLRFPSMSDSKHRRSREARATVPLRVFAANKRFQLMRLLILPSISEFCCIVMLTLIHKIVLIRC